MRLRQSPHSESQSVLAALLLGAGLTLAACGDRTAEQDKAAPPETSQQAEPAAPMPADVDADRLANADQHPGQWMSHGRSYKEQRFSPLTQINDENVGELGLAWYVDLNEPRGIEATPVVVDGVMYTTSAWSVVYAIDAKTGEVLWTHDPQVPREWGAYACCDVVNRGVAVWDGKVYVGTLDGRLVALDAATGEVVFDVNTIDRSQPYTITGAPRAIAGKIIIGNGGADYGVRGYVTAYDAETGKQAWRFYTVPGNPEEGFESEALERAAETWTGEWWTLGGGGTVWDSMAYDPELGLLYIGVGNGSPWNQQVRSPGGGDNLYLSSIVALDAETGEYAWHYQGTPGETWDYTHTQSIILADLTIKGEERKVLMQAPKNGFFFVIDRTNGEFISAEPYVPVTWAEGYDYETGRPIEAEGARFTEKPAVLLPGPYGAHNWQPMAFSPQTGLAYIPALQLEGLYQNEEPFEVEKGRYNTGTDLAIASLPDDAAQRKAMKPLIRGHLSAWDPIKQEEAWRVPYDYSWNGGVMATAGNLVFQGTADAHLRAYAADTGEELWSAPAQTGIIAGPVSYEVDGEQYISVMAGWGGAFGLTAAYFAPEINQFKISRVLTFKLGGDKTLPPLDMTQPPMPEPPAQTASEETIAEGRYAYHRFCQFCHGDKVVARGVVTDLRRSATLHDPDLWQEIVIGGALAENGMVSFKDNISPEEADAIRHYVIKRAHETIAQQAESEEN